MAVILITGGSGLLAINWAIQRRNTDQVHCLMHHRMINIDGVTSHAADLLDLKATRALVEEIAPDIIVHTAGLTNVNECELDPEKSRIANFQTAENVARICAALSIKLVHISTDHLFDGSTALASETHPVAPQNNYARHKYEAEQAVTAHHQDALVIRTTFFGWGPHYRRSFSDNILDMLENEGDLHMFDDVFFTPLSTRRLIDLTHRVIDLGYSGILNICGGERISKYEFSVKLAKVFGHDPDFIQPVQAGRRRSHVRRPQDLSLSSSRMNELLGLAPATVDEVIDDLKTDLPLRDEIRRLDKVIPYGKHYVDQNDINAVVKTLQSGSLTQGPTIPAFEKRIAEYVGVQYAVAVSSATAGLHLAYKALGLGPGQSVLTSPITFVSTANAAEFCGGKARFADVDSETVNLDYVGAEKAIASHDDISIVAPVLFGGAADGMPELATMARARGKKIVEDAAHGLGGAYQCGAKIGSCKYSDCTVFSLHPVKSIAAGEGGIITTNDEATYRSLLRLRSHGINKNDDPFVATENAFTDGALNPWYYEMRDIGYHYRITDIQISLAMSQLDKLDAFIQRRRDLVHRYREWCRNLPFLEHAQNIDPDCSANHLFVGAFDFAQINFNRNTFMHALRTENIISQVHYIPVVMQPYYANQGNRIKDFPAAAAYYDKALSLPLYYALEDAELSHVMKVIERLAQHG